MCLWVCSTSELCQLCCKEWVQPWPAEDGGGVEWRRPISSLDRERNGWSFPNDCWVGSGTWYRGYPSGGTHYAMASTRVHWRIEDMSNLLMEDRVWLVLTLTLTGHGRRQGTKGWRKQREMLLVYIACQERKKRLVQRKLVRPCHTITDERPKNMLLWTTLIHPDLLSSHIFPCGNAGGRDGQWVTVRLLIQT